MLDTHAHLHPYPFLLVKQTKHDNDTIKELEERSTYIMVQ